MRILVSLIEICTILEGSKEAPMGAQRDRLDQPGRPKALHGWLHGWSFLASPYRGANRGQLWMQNVFEEGL